MHWRQRQEAVTNDALRSAAADLVRNLDRPERLIGNALASRFLIGVPSVSDDAGLARLRHCVNDIVAGLAAQQRILIERCDIRGERHRSVAAALNITERHFYRVRKRALTAIVAGLRLGRSRAERVRDLPSGARVGVVLGTSLDQVGKRKEAQQELRRAASECTDIDERLRLESALARQHAVAGEMAAADDCLARLERAHPVSGEERLVFDARVSVARASVAAVKADPGSAAAHVRKAIVTLRAACSRAPSIGVIEAFASALLIEAEHLQDIGAADAALERSREAIGALECTPDASPLLALQAVTSEQIILGRVQGPGKAFESTGRLRDLHSAALRFGLVQQSLVIAAELAALYRIRGQPQRALATLRPLLPTVRTVCTARDAGITLLDAAAAHDAIGELDTAAALTREVSQMSGLDPYTEAMANLRSSELYLRMGKATDALTTAGEARQAFTRMSNARLTGSALRVEAESYLARGNRAAAKLRIAAALDLLRGTPYPFAVSRAIAVSAQIVAPGA